MPLTRRFRAVPAAALALALLTSGCGGDDRAGGSDDPSGTVAPGEIADGGELIDGAQLSAENLVSFDPGLALSIDEAQVTAAIFDGLTDFDYTDVSRPVLKPLVAESFEPNEDATVWTFKIKPGQVFANGDPVLPSSFKFAWQRAGRASFASSYGYLINLIKDGWTMQEEDSTVTELDAIVADDEAMTLTVTLEAPNADFAAIVSHTFFMPLPEEEVSKDMDGWGEGAMIGNGPFTMESAPTDDEVVLVRNERWSGNVLGDTRARLDKITFKITKDPATAYTDFESGNVMTAVIPPGRFADAQATYPNTVDSPALGVYDFVFGWVKNPQLSDEERDNSLLRKAISLAIDREQINAKVYEGSRALATGVAMPGVPGYKEGLCRYCAFDLDEAKRLLQQWKDEGGTLDGPITIDFNTGEEQEGVVAIVQENLRALGIESATNPVSEEYYASMAAGGCHFCRAGWYADYPTYGNFTYDLFSTDSIGGNNYGSFSDPTFDDLVARAQAEPDDVRRAELYQQAEDYLLNDRTAVVPINFYKGVLVHSEDVVNFEQPPLGLILWERVGLRR